MRFKLSKSDPNIGDIEVRSWFAIIPVQINDEIRWLEKVTVESQYSYSDSAYFWKMKKFID